jgi:hypothetical protein
LIAFNLTNSGLIIIRREAPNMRSLTPTLVGTFNVLALIASFVW